jgi:GNAT superfamily N-acetyltransferase
MQVYTEPASPHWDLSPLQSPQGAVYLFLACTAPEARSRSIGAALLAAGMTWAQSAGYERCALHYATASRAAAFWRGLGFRPVTHLQCRVVDQRRTWTGGRT